jgi:RIO-like serine/threonine protein kinase
VDDGATSWTIKDFRRRSFWVRNTIGRFLLRRELAAVARLRGIRNVPAPAYRVDAHAIALRFIPGVNLGKAEAARLAPAFFEALERLFREVHARGLVHLDTRGTGNLLVTPEGEPAIIDFQAALDVRRLPRRWQRWLADFDLAGIYKQWMRRDAASMGAARVELYERMTRWRRLWIFRGYLGASKKRATSGGPSQR